MILLSLLFVKPAHASSNEAIDMPCADLRTQSQRSLELRKILEADQADRGWQTKGQQPSQKLLEEMSRHDLVRRKRVGEIFGEGCLKTVADYRAAFFVFQHGNVPDHYFQAFIWAKHALGLGDDRAKSDVAMAIDRYLVSIDHKQLFGTQASMPSPSKCWCIQPVDETFPQSIRDEYRGGGNSDYTGLAYLKILNVAQKDCPVAYCNKDLQPSPKGLVPGFW